MVRSSFHKPLFSLLIAIAVVLVVLIALPNMHITSPGSFTTSYGHLPQNTLTSHAVTSSVMPTNKGEVNSFVMPNSSLYRLAVENLKEILREAKNIYLEALEKNETWRILIYEPYSNCSRVFILNSTTINETILYIGNTTYRYIIVNIYNHESKFSFMPQRIRVDDVSIELLPRSKSVTYMGAMPYEYLTNYGCRAYRVSFTSIGFVEATKNHVVSTNKVDNNIYKVKITLTGKSGGTEYVDKAWLILVKIVVN